MNKKGKNKKGKTINPIPSQKEKPSEKNEEAVVAADKDTANISSATAENVVVKSVSVKEERVPEIVNEVIMLSINTKDEETPKKPKRNRGKKKKGTDEVDDNLTEDNETKSNEILPPAEEKCIDIAETIKEPQDESSAVTPTARKKKNKKKTLEQKVEEPILLVTEQTLSPEVVSNTSQDFEKPETKQDPNMDRNRTAQELKQSKKKNKKKNRNDSERSDKEDITCTSAFQKLVDASNESLEVKTEEKILINIVPTESSLIMTESASQKEISLQNTMEKTEIKTPMEEISTINETAQLPTNVTETKNKKHHKKDQKGISKCIEKIDPCDKSSIESVRIVTEQKIMTQDITEHELLKNITTGEKTDNVISSVEETTSKQKATIAKPVEKKRKEKQDCKIIQLSQQTEMSYESSKAEKEYSQFTDCTGLKETDKGTVTGLENKNILQAVLETSSLIVDIESNQPKELEVQDVELPNIADKSEGRKRKKGPKTPIIPNVGLNVIEPKFETKILNVKTSDVTETVTTTSEMTPMIKSETSIVKEASSSSTKIDTPAGISIPVKSQEHILLTPEITDSKDLADITTEVISSKASKTVDNSLKTDFKSDRKKRNSSKSPSKALLQQKIPEPLIQNYESSEQTTLPSEELRVDKIRKKLDKSNITKLYDIEITSVNVDESEGSTCDTVPDVTYPRSSSQQLADDNNNSTTIREIFPIQQFASDVSNQENIKTSNVDLAIREKKEKIQQKAEKTDLKSKMLEVNQDMEELRLSIERSLAELTSMEKHDPVVEKQFKETKLIEYTDILPQMKEEVSTKKESVEYKKNIEASEIDIPKEIPRSKVIREENIVDKVESLTSEQSVDITEQVMATTCNIKSDIKLESAAVEITTDSCKKITSVTDTKTAPGPPTSIAEKLTETLLKFDTRPLIKRGKIEETSNIATVTTKEEIAIEQQPKHEDPEIKVKIETQSVPLPICPTRKDQKNKNKKKKGKQDTQNTATQSTQGIQSATTAQATTATSSTTSQESKEEEKNKGKKESKSDNQGKGKQQASNIDAVTEEESLTDMAYEPIENFEDALTSSADDVNQSFEMIVKESQEQSNPKINIIAPDEEKSIVKPSKNLLGHPDIPVRSNKRDYKKEKDKIPNEISAKVKIKDSVEVEGKQTKNTQTINKLKDLKYYKTSDNEEFVYKYNFRKVFLQNICHVCKKDLSGARLACCYCNLVFYCGIKHKDEDWPQHQALCFAVSTIGHLKDQKHIYADAKNITGHDYRLIRMQMIVSCEKILKRRLVPWEQEALLYPRICAFVPCREWRQMKLSDCQGCAQISFCTDNPDHCPKSHSRWCKSYSLYQKLVSYQQTKGRLEPKLPTKVMQDHYEIPEKINEVLAAMYEEKIDMNDIQYAALTQLATAPLTAVYCHQLCSKMNGSANGYKSNTFVVHVVGAELQFEADALNKWEVFFLHLRPHLQELSVVLINCNLNPSKLPLDLLGKIKVCENCCQKKRNVVFSFQEKLYADYKRSEDFALPDIVCAFNPSIQRSSIYNGKDPWPSTVNIIMKQKIPFIITAYTMSELQKDCMRIKECADIEYKFISEPKYNNFASVRPDRNFISDDEMPLLFKNYCFAVICG